MKFKYSGEVRIESTDVETMKKVYNALKPKGHGWKYREIDGYVDPFTGAHISNLPIAQIVVRGGSNSRIGCWFGKKVIIFCLSAIFKLERFTSQIQKES